MTCTAHPRWYWLRSPATEELKQTVLLPDTFGEVQPLQFEDFLMLVSKIAWCFFLVMCLVLSPFFN